MGVHNQQQFEKVHLPHGFSMQNKYQGLPKDLRFSLGFQVQLSFNPLSRQVQGQDGCQNLVLPETPQVPKGALGKVLHF